MAYNKEYYEAHKEIYKNANSRYVEKNRDLINSKARYKYNSLSEEEREERNARRRKQRAQSSKISKIQYRIDMCKRFIKKYEDQKFILELSDTLTIIQKERCIELSNRIKHYKDKVEELTKEKEALQK